MNEVYFGVHGTVLSENGVQAKPVLVTARQLLTGLETRSAVVDGEEGVGGLFYSMLQSYRGRFGETRRSMIGRSNVLRF